MVADETRALEEVMQMLETEPSGSPSGSCLARLNICLYIPVHIGVYCEMIFFLNENTGNSIKKGLFLVLPSCTPTICLKWHNSNPSNKLVEASICLPTISLPVAYSCYKGLEQSCPTSLFYSSEGFAN